MCFFKTFQLLFSLSPLLSLFPVFVRLPKKHAFKQFRKNLRIHLSAKVYFSICSKSKSVISHLMSIELVHTRPHFSWSENCFGWRKWPCFCKYITDHLKLLLLKDEIFCVFLWQLKCMKHSLCIEYSVEFLTNKFKKVELT